MRLTAVVLAVLALACGSTSVRQVQTNRYYGYMVSASASLDREPPPTPPEKAVSALKKLKRVAFVPPDMCLDMRAGDTSSTVDKRVLRMQCGVTMSELEREAERVGFDVVTWQSLKGSRPLDQAKEQKIELLFEVNELDVVEDRDRAESQEFKYFSGEGNNPPAPLQVTAADNDTCKAYHAQNAPKISGLTSVLDIKMVQVANGSVLWSYRHEENARADVASSLIRFPVAGRQTFKTARPWWPWLIVLGGVGLIAAGVEPVALGAGVAGAGVIALLIVGKKTKPVGTPEYEPVSAVLCRKPHIQDVPVRAPVVTAEVKSSSFKSETKTNTKDPLEERRRELIKKSVQIFMKQLASAGA